MIHDAQDVCIIFFFSRWLRDYSRSWECKSSNKLCKAIIKHHFFKVKVSLIFFYFILKVIFFSRILNFFIDTFSPESHIEFRKIAPLEKNYLQFDEQVLMAIKKMGKIKKKKKRWKNLYLYLYIHLMIIALNIPRCKKFF